LEGYEPIRELGSGDAQQAARFDQVKVELVAGLLAVVASDGGPVPHAGHKRARRTTVDFHVRTEADDQHHARERTLEPTQGCGPLVEVRGATYDAAQLGYGLELLDPETHTARIICKPRPRREYASVVGHAI
jgi:hypothetical protein